MVHRRLRRLVSSCRGTLETPSARVRMKYQNSERNGLTSKQRIYPSSRNPLSIQTPSSTLALDAARRISTSSTSAPEVKKSDQAKRITRWTSHRRHYSVSEVSAWHSYSVSFAGVTRLMVEAGITWQKWKSQVLPIHLPRGCLRFHSQKRDPCSSCSAAGWIHLAFCHLQLAYSQLMILIMQRKTTPRMRISD